MIEATIFHGIRAIWVVMVVGGIIGLILAVAMDYWDTPEYRKNFKRNLRELKNDHS